MEWTTTQTSGDSADNKVSSHYQRTRVIVEMIFCAVIIFTSFTGNALVVFVACKDSTLRTTTNIFIQNLALTDISMAIFNMPFWMASIYHDNWIFSQLVCEYQAVTLFTFGSASILTMALISINRYFKIVHPQIYHNYFGSKVIVCIYCLLSWVVGVIFATPPIYGWGNYQYHRKFMTCSVLWDLKHISFVAIFLGGFVNAVTITIFVCYYKIYREVKQSSRNVAAYANNVTSETDIKILKSTFTVVCGYIICWMPVSVVCLTETLGGFLPQACYGVAIFLMYSSCCINPIIYGILNPQFRRAFIQVFKCKSFHHDNSSNQDERQENASATLPSLAIRRIASANKIS
ncbi:visual pigment-like receptor peropsin [Actinia tenebrosa]|uniref:Visual pigment-like receptor peropsin n=1 Tax=Actinia tenebrosa TaxID=6105 RepID=A0A6P8H4S2_ACTTE|nr:visual pigment-like receptor peropsin [Actinia tenebrosa]